MRRVETLNVEIWEGRETIRLSAAKGIQEPRWQGDQCRKRLVIRGCGLDRRMVNELIAEETHIKSNRFKAVVPGECIEVVAINCVGVERRPLRNQVDMIKTRRSSSRSRLLQTRVARQRIFAEPFPNHKSQFAQTAPRATART